jgi:hypothetical protein
MNPQSHAPHTNDPSVLKHALCSPHTGGDVVFVVILNVGIHSLMSMHSSNPTGRNPGKQPEQSIHDPN